MPQVEATINAKVKYKKVGANRSENARCRCKFRPIRSAQVSLPLKGPQEETVIVNILCVSLRDHFFWSGAGALLMGKTNGIQAVATCN